MNVYVHTLLNAFLREGWVVVMTDYEGLGVTDRRHPYLLGVSEAAGVLDIVSAARRLFSTRICSRFAIVGHSQGGQAALFAASHAPAWDDLDLVGVAAIAPANHILGVVRAGALLPVKNEGYGFTPLLLSGALGGDPQIRPDQVLSDTAFTSTGRTWTSGAEPDSAKTTRGKDSSVPSSSRAPTRTCPTTTSDASTPNSTP